MKPFRFEELQKILELKDTEIEKDELIFNSTLTYIEKKLGYQLEDRNYNEIQTVRDHKIYTDHDNITEMISIIDMNTKQRVTNCVINRREIFILSPKYENHVLFLNYNAGFTAETLPADLKEAIIKLFLIKKKEFVKQSNNEDYSLEPLKNLEEVINLYRRKTL